MVTALKPEFGVYGRHRARYYERLGSARQAGTGCKVPVDAC